MARTFHPISYDIPDNKRRLRIADLLKSYGERVRYSISGISVTEAQLH